MAKKVLVDSILKLYSKLGGNVGEVLGTRSNISFLGTGKSPEGFIDSTINIDAIGALGKNKVLEELKSSIGYLTANKLNDLQAGKLYENMLKIDEVFYPKQIPNITDMATGNRDLTQEGLGALRATRKTDDDLRVVKDEVDLPEGVDPRDTILPTGRLRTIEEIIANPRKMADEASFPGETYAANPEQKAGMIKSMKEIAKGDSDLIQKLDDLPPPGEPQTIADRISEYIKKVRENKQTPWATDKPIDDFENYVLKGMNVGKAGPLDPVTGLTRTLARRILDKKGIEVGKGDPLNVFTEKFSGQVLTDVKNLAEDMLEAEKQGRKLKSMDELLEIEGLFDVKLIKDNPYFDTFKHGGLAKILEV
jgi:hypothetical protein